MTYSYNRRRGAVVNYRGYDKDGKYHPLLPTQAPPKPKPLASSNNSHSVVIGSRHIGLISSDDKH